MKSYLVGWLLLLVCYFVGNVLTLVFSLPIPSILVGLVLLLSLLLLRQRPPTALAKSAQPLLKHMSVLFVPATLGVILYWPLIRDNWLPLLLAIVGSTLLSLAIVAKVNSLVLRKRKAS